MFGPLPAIGLVELTAELKTMPDVEVETYVHQAWPSLVDDLGRQPPGTHTVVVGYSLGANSSVFVANNAKHVDTDHCAAAVDAELESAARFGKSRAHDRNLQSQSVADLGRHGIEETRTATISNTSRNSDSHPGAQFNSEFPRSGENRNRQVHRGGSPGKCARPLTPFELAQLAQPDHAQCRASRRRRIDVGRCGRGRTIRRSAEPTASIAQGEILDLAKPGDALICGAGRRRGVMAGLVPAISI